MNVAVAEPVVRKPVGKMDKAELLDALKDPLWRLRNLYWIKDKEGHSVLFQPWEEQQKFYDNLWWRNVIPKARQRGFSTAVQIMMLDACLFVPNTSAAVVAQDDDIAMQIFKNKIKFAWERLPDIVRQMIDTRYDNLHELAFDNDSSIIVATSTRGNTLQWLHVSEFGQICAKFPERANEIVEGSLPSAAQGITVVESTVETPFGPFSDMVKQAERIQQSGRPLTRQDYRLHFASWWDAPEYETDPEHIAISPRDAAYFFRTEAAIGRPISKRKRAWYVLTRDNEFGGSDEKMFRQYPSTLKEAFAVSSEGLWLSRQLARARTEGRICKLPIATDIPVNTFWDIGVEDDIAIWLHQKVGPWDHFIGFIEASSEPYSYVVREMNAFQAEHGFVWGAHYLPHDANQRRPGAEALKTPRDMLNDLGLKNIEIVPRIHAVVVGIEQLREDFRFYRFDEERTKDGVTHLEGFSKVFNNTMQIWTPAIADNGHQHAADAIRQKAQWKEHIREHGGGSRPKRRRSARAA
jgi:hypothetical protein